ncbi:MAG: hypothetical protein ACI85N_002433 [Gammaproteobacteria bacterium]|jgi:hypothetical protein
MTTDKEDFVTSTINYSLDNGSPLDYYFYEPDPSIELNPPGTDPHELKILNGWSRVDEFSLDHEGFELKPINNTFEQFDDDNAIKNLFYPLIVEFVKKHTGANRIEVFDHTIRKPMSEELKDQTDVQRPTVQLAHSDYTPKSGPQRVREILPDDADLLLKHRVAFFNVWKPLYRTVEEFPLAMCDETTAAKEDKLIMELKYSDRTGEIFVFRYSPAHRWYYFPRMTPEQALLLKTYETDPERSSSMGHSAFEDPSSPPNAATRESIEIRTMAFF